MRASDGRTAVGEENNDEECMYDLDGDLVDLIQDVDCRNVDAIALNDVNQLICCGITAESNVCIVDAVLA